MIVVFTPGLWPFRSPLDATSWYLAEGTARALSAVPELLAYATPRALVDPTAEPARPGGPPIRALRSLPPIDLVRSEAAALGAEVVLTGRILTDHKGSQIWLNALSGASGDLTWTGHANTDSGDLLWRWVGLLRRWLTAEGSSPQSVTVQTVAGTGSWAGFVAYARARHAVERWRGDGREAVLVLDAASRALGLDPSFRAADDLLSRWGEPLVAAIEDLEVCGAARDALADKAELPVLIRLRRLVHERYLALSKASAE